ncbi:hypothetical protein [Agromyces sp. NPDC055661]
MVERAEMLAAQVFTARRMADSGRVADLRVAVILFDSVMETLMVRRIDDLFALYRIGQPRPWEEVQPVEMDLRDASQKQRVEEASGTRLVPWRISKTQRLRIDREFGAKLQLLAWHGDLRPELVPVATRLHEYRNEVYHRDQLRRGSLLVTANLAASVVAEMLRALRPGVVGSYGSDTRETLRRIYEWMGRPDDAPADPLAMFTGLDLQEKMADALLDGLDDRLEATASALSDYARGRLEAWRGNLRFIGDFVFSGSEFDEFDAVRVVHCDRPPELTLASLRGMPCSITKARIRAWDEYPTRIGLAADRYDAARLLAEFEADFEPSELKVSEVASDVDGEIQRQIDWMRGK